MNNQAFKKVRLALGLTAVVLAVGALASVGSAAAATQHWASATPATQISPGSYQSFTGKNQGRVEMKWRVAGAWVVTDCSNLSTSGTVGNPASGGSGTLGETTLELGGCTPNLSGCQIVNESIPFERLKGHALDEAGEERVRFEPNAGSTMAVIHFNAGCSIGTSVTVTGSFEGTSVPSQSGEYQVTHSNLKVGENEFRMVAELSLAASSEQPLALSSEGSPGTPHWYLASGKWTLIPAGEPTNYWSSAVPLTLNTKIAGGKVEISQCEGIDVGSVENPAGGGAGTASSTLTPGWASGCQINVKGCFIESVTSGELPGRATEVGAVPAVEWSPSSGSTVMVFHLGHFGSSECTLGTAITVTGKLIAISVGDGRFNLAASELKVGEQKVTVSSEFGLETLAGKSLRLQP
jgi:hypothetical protein